MSVVTSIEDTGSCRKKLTIEIPAAAVEAEMGRVVGKYRKSLRLPGFRRGKVPVSMVHQRFRDAIRQEVVDTLLPRYWHQAEAEKGLDPLAPPKVEELDLEPGKPMTVVASVETRPAIELGDFRNFDLPSENTEPAADEIEGALTDLRRQHAEWSPVERPAARGDLVVGQITAAGDEGSEAGEQPIQVELGGDGVDDELTLTLTGRSAGQTAEYRRRDGDGDGDGEEQDLRIEVAAVKEQELPELDDDLASRFGVESADALRQAVTDDLRRGRERKLQQRRRQAMLEQLCQRHPLELPAGVIDQQAEQMLEEYAGQLQRQGVDIENADIEWETLAGQIRPQAERRVHEQLLLDAIAAAENQRLDEQEFERVLSALAAPQKTSSMALRQQLSESGRLESLRTQMLRDQTVRWLLGEEGPGDEAAGEEAVPSEEAPSEEVPSEEVPSEEEGGGSTEPEAAT